MKIYDLRSDTITRPDSGMRQAMNRADVGDDVYGEDPTVNRLQEMACEITDKPASLFVPSGSMGNLLAIYILCGRGREILAHKNSHICHLELGSAAVLAGAVLVAVDGEKGILTPDALRSRLRPDIYYMSKIGMIEIENSHNLEGGVCYNTRQLRELGDFARQIDTPLHLDGARCFNAALATGVSVKEQAAYCDSLTFCLSKGLGAPVGALICGEKEFIREARIIRKMLGGAMRQAGILAAAGIYALENRIERLAEDHQNARLLTEALRQTSWAKVDLSRVQTNIIWFDTVQPASLLVEKLAAVGVLAGAMGPKSIRLVTSSEVAEPDIKEVCRLILNLEVDIAAADC